MSEPHRYHTCITRAHTSTRLRHKWFICKLLRSVKPPRRFVSLQVLNKQLSRKLDTLGKTAMLTSRWVVWWGGGGEGAWRKKAVMKYHPSPGICLSLWAYECLESEVGKCHHMLLWSFFHNIFTWNEYFLDKFFSVTLTATYESII